MEHLFEILVNIGTYLGTIERYVLGIAIGMALAPIFYRDHQDFTKKGGE